jgi:hypothetical protein
LLPAPVYGIQAPVIDRPALRIAITESMAHRHH